MRFKGQMNMYSEPKVRFYSIRQLTYPSPDLEIKSPHSPYCSLQPVRSESLSIC